MTNLVMENPTIVRDEGMEKKIQEWMTLQWKKYSKSTDNDEELDGESDSSIYEDEDDEDYQEEDITLFNADSDFN